MVPTLYDDVMYGSYACCYWIDFGCIMVLFFSLFLQCVCISMIWYMLLEGSHLVPLFLCHASIICYDVVKFMWMIMIWCWFSKVMKNHGAHGVRKMAQWMEDFIHTLFLFLWNEIICSITIDALSNYFIFQDLNG